MSAETKSPSDPKELVSNLGGMPPKWTTDQTFAENTPPNRAPQPAPIDTSKGGK